MSSTDRKQYDETMVGLRGFGQIFTPSGCISVADAVLAQLKPLVPADVEITWEQLNQNVAESYVQQKELNLSKENDGCKEDVFSEKTEIYGIFTGFTGITTAEEGCGSEIYAFFHRFEDIWMGVHFSTKEQMLKESTSAYLGKLMFTNQEKKLQFLTTVKENLLPGELLSFGEEGNLEILQDYLTQVSEKLYQEHNVDGTPNAGKIIFSENETMVLFHSGLLNKFTGEMFMVGTKSSFATGGFLIENPSLVTGAKELIRHGFEPSSCPEKPTFFTELQQLNFHATSNIVLDEVKLGEIIEDAAERGYFPEAYEGLCEAGAWSTMVGLLKTAVEKAQNIAKYRYFYVVPRYNPPIGTRPCEIQFMMPIYLQTDLIKEPDFLGNPDFVLVLQPTDEGYTPESIIILTEAYHSGKMITTPDNGWLQGAEISYTPREMLQRFLVTQQKNIEELVSFMAEETPQVPQDENDGEEETELSPETEHPEPSESEETASGEEEAVAPSEEAQETE